MSKPRKIIQDGTEYISKKYLINYLVLERLRIRRHLKSQDWKYDWPVLREYEKTLTDFLYLLRKRV